MTSSSRSKGEGQARNVPVQTCTSLRCGCCRGRANRRCRDSRVGVGQCCMVCTERNAKEVRSDQKKQRM